MSTTIVKFKLAFIFDKIVEDKLDDKSVIILSVKLDDEGATICVNIRAEPGETYNILIESLLIPKKLARFFI